MSESRFDILLNRYAEKKSGSINHDLMQVIFASNEVQRLKMELLHAEQALKHAVRGLDHRDYDDIFSGWERC